MIVCVLCVLCIQPVQMKKAPHCFPAHLTRWTPIPALIRLCVDCTCVCAEPVQVKKRGRRNKNRESRLEQRESELEFMAETFLQQLHSLPSVALREPDITVLYSIVPIKGGPSLSGRFSSGWSFIRVVLHQGGFPAGGPSSGWFLTGVVPVSRVGSHQGGLSSEVSSGWSFIRSIIRVIFHQRSHQGGLS